MAAPSSRPLTLPEELEKLEQSITLTLQEIDANFSRAHRIVTSSIIPTVASYGRHSDAVWQGTKFWKEFFEASANISLTGYEEDAGTDAGELTQTTMTDDGRAEETVRSFDSEDATERPQSRLTDEMGDDSAAASSLIESPSTTTRAATHTTPNAQQSMAAADEGTSSFADYPSPYETLKKEIQGDLTTPGRNVGTPGYRPSPFKQTTEKRRPPNPDPLLHRVLDQNYRVRATPHTARKERRRSPVKDPTPQPTRTLNPALDSSPFSPAMEAPQLRAEIFGTPGDKKRKGRVPPTNAGPRTPGVSVQRPRSKSGFTPGGDGLGTTRKTLFTAEKTDITAGPTQDFDLDWDSDDDSAPFGGMSPPKTIQFDVPHSKLLQTPAKEASKRIVDDLLLTAGGGDVTDSQQDLGEAPATQLGDRKFDSDDDSPSIVRVAYSGLGEDDTF